MVIYIIGLVVFSLILAVIVLGVCVCVLWHNNKRPRKKVEVHCTRDKGGLQCMHMIVTDAAEYNNERERLIPSTSKLTLPPRSASETDITRITDINFLNTLNSNSAKC